MKRRTETPLEILTASEWTVALAAVQEYRRRQQVTIQARVVPEPKAIAQPGIRFYRPGE